ncbi:hypothetical protein DCE79_10680 [Lysinibacillus sp. 2017]|uniref:hypothetical protein n=1 Tax=unclassified Lysinibacillus TaxID=2636778 RepID=UPI000D5273AB|nr:MULTISPECIES: hypothetical protein [unclassified Lysinibacillus]AWE07820.1 hypothetical protein DCE79_10680 [Lysinibacillus sp. 2017]TGN32287.1 hypothetical protein E4L99_15690 [Lysinibacillus sp. S2017]
MKRWTWLIIIGVLISGYIYNISSAKYRESSVSEVFKIVESDYSKELYTTGTINYVSEDITENKKATLSTEMIANLLNQLENTKVTGIKQKDLNALTELNYYIIDLESTVADNLILFVSQDENTGNSILEVFAIDKKLADKYLMRDKEVFNLIAELIKQAH